MLRRDAALPVCRHAGSRTAWWRGADHRGAESPLRTLGGCKVASLHWSRSTVRRTRWSTKQDQVLTPAMAHDLENQSSRTSCKLEGCCKIFIIYCRLLQPEHLAILKSPEIIAVNQDPLGIAGDLVWKQGSKEVSLPPHRNNMQSRTVRMLLTSSSLQVWAGPLAGGDRAVVLFNRLINLDPTFQSSNITVSWQHIGVPSSCKARPFFSFARGATEWLLSVLSGIEACCRLV